MEESLFKEWCPRRVFSGRVLGLGDCVQWLTAVKLRYTCESTGLPWGITGEYACSMVSRYLEFWPITDVQHVPSQVLVQNHFIQQRQHGILRATKGEHAGLVVERSEHIGLLAWIYMFIHAKFQVLAQSSWIQLKQAGFMRVDTGEYANLLVSRSWHSWPIGNVERVSTWLPI
jgi:hypothetical protein